MKKIVWAMNVIYLIVKANQIIQTKIINWKNSDTLIDFYKSLLRVKFWYFHKFLTSSIT